MGTSMTDTIFLTMVGLFGFIMGAAACRDIEKVFEDDATTRPPIAPRDPKRESIGSFFDRLWSGARSIMGLFSGRW